MKRWYVVQVYAGYEEAARRDVEVSVAQAGLSEQFGQVLIPEAKTDKSFGEDPDTQQLFPGYMLIEMDLTPEMMLVVKRCPRVLYFLGGEDPAPLSQREVDQVLSQVRGEVKVASVRKERFAVGGEVEILDGPFSGFVGIIDRVDDENEKLAVMVSIFGRMTPVELGFHQVKQ